MVAPERVQAMLSAAEDGYLYRIQSSTSRVGFCADSKLSRVKAEFRDFQGGLSLWPNSGEDEQAMIVIRADSLHTDDLITARLLKSEHFFDVENYPEVLFVSTNIHWTNDSTAVLTGDLTLHGVTRVVKLQVQLTSMKKETGGHIEKVVARAGTTIKRSDFGMNELSQVVNDNVELCMIVEAVRYDNSLDSANNSSAQAGATVPK